MDGFAGSRSTIAVVTDYTDPEMYEWTRTLVDEYLTSPWVNTQCGYGCTCRPFPRSRAHTHTDLGPPPHSPTMSVGSDHASWTAIGVPASFPFGASPSPLPSASAIPFLRICMRLACPISPDRGGL